VSYAAPAPAVSFAAPAPAVTYAASAPALTYTVPQVVTYGVPTVSVTVTGMDSNRDGIPDVLQ